MSELYAMSVRQMAELARTGELYPVEALVAHPGRIEQVNPLIRGDRGTFRGREERGQGREGEDGPRQ